MFRRKHAPDLYSNDAEQKEAKVSLKCVVSHKFVNSQYMASHCNSGAFVSFIDELGADKSHATISYEQINELKSQLGPLSARAEKYCSKACLKRYLEARNWNVVKSRKMLEESLKWRAAYRPEDFRWVNLLFLFH